MGRSSRLTQRMDEDDCDGLLGSDDEVALDDQKIENTMLDISELENNAPVSRFGVDKSNPIFLDLLEEEPVQSSDDEKELEGDEEKAVNEIKKQAEEIERRVKLENTLGLVPPGIDLFPTVNDKTGKLQNGFVIFELDSISLEKDFGYKRRGKLLGHGFTTDEINLMLRDKLEFVKNLHPAAQSVLICDKQDFKAVMNFLLASISVCTDPTLSELMMKCMIELRMNYAFSWSLKLRHVTTVLRNYGVASSAVLNDKYFNRPNVGLLKYLEEVAKTGQTTSKKFSLPKLPRTFEEQAKINKNQLIYPKTTEEFQFCLSRFLLLCSEFTAGFPSHVELHYKADYSDQLVLLFLLLLLGTDCRLVGDVESRENITNTIHFLLDNVNKEQWKWGPTQKSDLDGFNHCNVHKTLARMVNEFFPGEEECRAVVRWEVGGTATTNHEGTSDHHLNLLARLQLLPHSYRGLQLRRYLAFLYLQTLAEIPYSLPTHVTIMDLTDSLDLCSKLSEGLKLIILSKNYPLTTTIVELYDIIVGHEPDLNFTEDKLEHIELLKRNVLLYISKKLPLSSCAIDLKNETSIQAMQLNETLDIVQARWEGARSLF